MNDITVEELKHRLDQGEKLNILDVREQYEFDEFNLGGKLIPLGTLPGRVEEIEDLKEQELIVHCRSGMRSMTAKAILEAQGFTKVRNLLGGTLDWERKFPA